MAKIHRARSAKLTLLPSDPYESAKIAGLRYVTNDRDGIRRRRAGTGFTYLAADGTPIRDSEVLRRIRSLVLPPAWTDVWICPFANGHLQAVGLDQKGRKQYRYHALYRAVRDATKFTRLVAFGLALPKVRAQVGADLKLPGMPRRKVLATVVRLLETTCIRVGNEEYRKENNSFGLTTLENKHVRITGYSLHFHFQGKSGQIHDIDLTDRRLARIVRECQCIPGHELFQYMNEQEEPVRVSSEHVNEYLGEITGEEFTAKDFRTWNGTRQAAMVLETMGPAETQAELKRNITEAVKQTAKRLGNRPATCRKYYIHPMILDSYSDGSLFDALRAAKPLDDPDELSREEVAVMRLLATHVPEPLKIAEQDKNLTGALKRSVRQAAQVAKSEASKPAPAVA